MDLRHEKVSFFSAAKTPPFSNPKTLKRHFSFFNSSTVDLPMLEARTCWSEPLLWVRNVLYHCSGLGTWKSFFFSAAKTPPLSNPKTLKRHFSFFNSSAVDLRTLEAQTFWSEPLLWVRNFLYHCSGLGTWKSFFFFAAAKTPHFSNPKTLKRHFSFFNSSTVNLPMLEARTCWSEPLLWVRNFFYHCSGLGTWKSFLFCSSQNSPFFKP